MNVITVSADKLARDLLTRKINVLLCFLIVLNFENVNFQSLFMLPHITKDYSLCFVKARIYKDVNNLVSRISGVGGANRL